MTDSICTIAELEGVLGTTSLGAQMKEIDHIDEGAAGFVAASPLAFVVGSGRAVQVTPAGGSTGFATVADERTLVLPADAMDSPEVLTLGEGAGVLFLVPGVTETLRINGRVTADGREIRIATDEVFIHCGKALIRSGFWSATPGETPREAGAFLEQARFVALATADRDGRADMSPKGDPAGRMLRRTEGSIVFADRPGNRRADGFRNIIEQPDCAALVLVPGSAMVATLRGRVRLTREERLRAAFEVDGKVPQLVSVMEDHALGLHESAALKRAALWPVAEGAGAGIDPSAILVGHVKLNKIKGEAATAMRSATTRGIVAKGLEQAYIHTLY